MEGPPWGGAPIEMAATESAATRRGAPRWSYARGTEHAQEAEAQAQDARGCKAASDCGHSVAADAAEDALGGVDIATRGGCIVKGAVKGSMAPVVVQTGAFRIEVYDEQGIKDITRAIVEGVKQGMQETKSDVHGFAEACEAACQAGEPIVEQRDQDSRTTSTSEQLNDAGWASRCAGTSGSEEREKVDAQHFVEETEEQEEEDFDGDGFIDSTGVVAMPRQFPKVPAMPAKFVTFESSEASEGAEDEQSKEAPMLRKSRGERRREAKAKKAVTSKKEASENKRLQEKPTPVQADFEDLQGYLKAWREW